MQQLEATLQRYRKLLQELIKSKSLSFDENLRRALQTVGGVYRIFEKGSDCQSSVYVGKSRNLQDRIYGNHFMGNRKASTLRKKLIDKGKYPDENAVKQYLKDKCLVQLVLIKDEAERASFEHFAVALLKPQYND